jgi:hypothetical protein
LFALLLACFVTLGIGCASGGDSSSAATTEEVEAPKIPIPADSPFAKIKEGMSSQEVVATIGPPTTSGGYQTGKAWIPFHYGGDNYRVDAHYKGIGWITYSSDSTFTSGMSVIEIHYDPTDPGFAT